MNNSVAASRFRAKINKFGAAAAAVPVALVSTSAFAAGESTQVLSVMNEYKEEAVLIIVGLAVILWTLRATGLLKPR